MILKGFRLAIALAALPALTVAAHADVKPGDKFNASNVAQIKDLISPGVQWCVEHGMPITIAETKPIEIQKAYKDATEKYSGQVKLSQDGRNISGYVAGMPFPKIDANDPLVAYKIMWNYDRKSLGTDDVDVRNFDADTGTIHTGEKEMTVERHFLLDHLRVLAYDGRLYQDPKPKFEPNPEQVQSKQGLYPILEPFDLKGVGTLSYRYLDIEKQDDTWLYLPTLRRVRRLSSAQRSDALFGQDTDVDSYYGYAGSPAWMDWKLLGEKEALGVMHAQNFPVKWADGSANFAFDDVWEKRKVYVVEAGPKKFSDFTLPYVLMRAAGRMPTKFCPGCERDLDLSLFVKRNSSSDGLGSICNECNRRNVKKHYEGRRARLQAALTGGNQDAA